jgi:signal transduction histidine kinase
VRHGVTKRSKGGTVAVITEETETGYKITVIDDGVGFDPSEKKQDGGSHVGIENVRSRLASMCGGTLDIRSQPGVGTTAVITIPKGA